MSGQELTRVAIALIRRDGGTQPREAVNTAVATEYGEQMALGAAFPPPVVFYDGADRWLASGFHRVFGAELTGATEMDVEIRQGTQRDAVLYSLGENATHGLRRTNGDKRRVIARLFEDPEWRKWSDRQIAKHLHVDGKTVASMRPRYTAEIRSERTFVNRHGGTSSMDVTNIASRPAPSAPPVEDAPAAVVKGSVQLRRFLGEVRAGADVESAAVVSEIGLGEAREHALAEARGDYADVVSIEPNWKIEDGHLILTLSGAEAVAETETVEAANDDTPTPAAPPPAFDFAIAQSREAVNLANVADGDLLAEVASRGLIRAGGAS